MLEWEGKLRFRVDVRMGGVAESLYSISISFKLPYLGGILRHMRSRLLPLLGSSRMLPVSLLCWIVDDSIFRYQSGKTTQMTRKTDLHVGGVDFHISWCADYLALQ